MQTNTFKTPVVMIVFNRPRTTRLVFDAIAKIRPARFLIVADGPRPDKPGEWDLCQQVRAIAQDVKWPCELLTNFSDVNLGCQERVISGLNWAFSLVEEAIILEDDCLPDVSFFPYCEELLERYRGDSRVGMISGDNFAKKTPYSGYSYHFSQMTYIWGWATWKSAWLRYDRHLIDWPFVKQMETLQEIFSDPKAVVYWTGIFEAMHRKTGPNVWSYQWLYSNLMNNLLTVVPRLNLVSNIGFGPDATHTTRLDSRFTIPAQTLSFPLEHPQNMVPLRSIDRLTQRLYSLPLGQRVVGKLQRMMGGLFPPIWRQVTARKSGA